MRDGLEHYSLTKNALSNTLQVSDWLDEDEVISKWHIDGVDNLHVLIKPRNNSNTLEKELISQKCLTYGCANRKNQGTFVGDLCASCYRMLISGEIGSGETFIHRLQIKNNALKEINTSLKITNEVLSNTIKRLE